MNHFMYKYTYTTKHGQLQPCPVNYTPTVFIQWNWIDAINLSSFLHVHPRSTICKTFSYATKECLQINWFCFCLFCKQCVIKKKPNSSWSAKLFTALENTLVSCFRIYQLLGIRYCLSNAMRYLTDNSPDAFPGLARGHHLSPIGVHIDVDLDVSVRVVGGGEVGDGPTGDP